MVISLVFCELSYEVIKTGSQDAGYHDFIPENSSHVDNMLPWNNMGDPVLEATAMNYLWTTLLTL